MAKPCLLLSLALIMIVEVWSFKSFSIFALNDLDTNFTIVKNMRLFDRLVEVTNAENFETTEIPPGSPLSLACLRTDLRLSFQCKQGTCGSCEVLLDGKVVRSCITKVPDKKAITVQKKSK